MGPSSQPQDDTSEKVVHKSPLTTDLERTESETEASAPKVDKEQGEVASTTVTSGVGISIHSENQAGSHPGQGHEALARSNLEPMQEDSGPGEEHVALAGPNLERMDEDFYATAYPKVHENLKLRTDEHVILENPKSSSATLSSMKNLDETDNFGDQLLNDKPTKDDQEKTNVVDETDSIIPDLSHQINTEATTIITTLPEITPFIALQLRVAKLEQDMSEVKKTDHSAAVLAFIQSHVPTVVEKYVGTKIDDALLKALERHTADLVEKYFVLRAPESRKKQQSKKSLKEIIRIKREQGGKKPEPKYTIKSTDKVALKEFDLKGALFNIIHKNKSANRNPANYRLYHALMEALIEDENALDKEVADKVKDHKRKHDSDDDQDDDDEGPSAGSNQDLEDTDNAHIPKVPAATWFKPIPEEERPATPEPEWTISSNDYPEPENNCAMYTPQRKKKLCKADLEGPTFNLVDLVNPEGHQILHNVYEPLPLGGPPGQLKAARYLDFGLEELVPYLWVECERDYDISAAYGITHWWFSRKEFYINKHREPSYRDAVRSHMRILSISEKDFKNLNPNDFEDIFVLHLQDKPNHLPKSDKVNLHIAVNMWIRNIIIRKRVEDLQLSVESYQTKLNMEQPNWDASDFLFKEDYTIINKPIADKLDFMVKDFRLFKFNKGMETRKWTKDDKRRSEDFIKRYKVDKVRNKTILRVLCIILVILPEHPSETKVFHNEDGNPARANIKLGSFKDGDGDGDTQSHKGVKASANSDIVYFFTSAQDGDPLQDDVRLCLADDLKKAHGHNQNKSK
ncbi:hypothetical protein Tco_1315271 [Tanacetum coccineum]